MTVPATAPMSVVSIQSWVATGHVGNAAAAFALQRLGLEVCALPTVMLSNHPGHGRPTGGAVPPGQLAALIEGIAARGVLTNASGLLTGYLGSVANAHVAITTADRMPQALYCCDPVLGDDGRSYVAPGIAEMIAAQAVPRADLLTPNGFELGLLTGADISSLVGACSAAASLAGRMRSGGLACVLVTSLATDETPPDSLDLLLHTPTGAHLLRRPRRAAHYSGAGDLLAALTFGRLLRGQALTDAVCTAVAGLEAVLAATDALGADELAMISAQDRLAAPGAVPAMVAL